MFTHSTQRRYSLWDYIYPFRFQFNRREQQAFNNIIIIHNWVQCGNTTLDESILIYYHWFQIEIQRGYEAVLCFDYKLIVYSLVVHLVQIMFIPIIAHQILPRNLCLFQNVNNTVGATSLWWSNEWMMVYFKLMMVKCSLMMVKC